MYKTQQIILLLCAHARFTNTFHSFSGGVVFTKPPYLQATHHSHIPPYKHPISADGATQPQHDTTPCQHTLVGLPPSATLCTICAPSASRASHLRRTLAAPRTRLSFPPRVVHSTSSRPRPAATTHSLLLVASCFRGAFAVAPTFSSAPSARHTFTPLVVPAATILTRTLLLLLTRKIGHVTTARTLYARPSPSVAASVMTPHHNACSDRSVAPPTPTRNTVLLRLLPVVPPLVPSSTLSHAPVITADSNMLFIVTPRSATAFTTT